VSDFKSVKAATSGDLLYLSLSPLELIETPDPGTLLLVLGGGFIHFLPLQRGCHVVSLIRFGEYCLQPKGKPEKRNPSHGYGFQVFPFTGNTSYSLLGVTVDFP
jgi:hypothetical protein